MVKLTNVISKDMLSHAILIETDNTQEGIMIAKSIAKLLLCNRNDRDASSLDCGMCSTCYLIENNSCPDFKIIETDSNFIKKQQLVDLKDDFGNHSLFNSKRIYIIKEAEKLNASSSNSLLKFLEEPEDGVFAIILTNNRYLLLDTIISRCQIFNFKNQDFLLDDEFLDDVQVILSYLVKKRNFFLDYKYLLEDVFKDKNNSKNLLLNVEKYLLNTLYISDGSEKEQKDKNVLSLEEVIQYIKIIELEIHKLEFNVNYKLWLDNFFSCIIGDVYERNSCCNN